MNGYYKPKTDIKPRFPVIEKYRQDNNMSYADMAKICGVNKDTVRNAIYGFRSPSVDFAINFLKYTGMKFEYAFAESLQDARSGWEKHIQGGAER